jgi:hypothetical protein
MNKRASFEPEREVEKILNEAWIEAARTNPMLLAKLRADFDFERLKQVIRDCMVEGHTRAEVRTRIVDELLGSARNDRQPHSRCDDTQSHPAAPK